MSISPTTGRAGVSLPHSWRAAPATEALRREYVQPDFDDVTWLELDVPGPWPTGEIDPTHGVLHRAEFTIAESSIHDDARTWLVFDGVRDQADVWLDGGYLGDTDGGFQPHEFEVSSNTAAQREHLLAIEVTADQIDDMDSIDGGVWAPVRIETSGPVRLRRHRIVCLDADNERATLRIVVDADSVDDRDITLRTRVGDHEHGLDQRVAAGSNRIEWVVHIARPRLWWPHSMGDQPMHHLTLDVLTDADEISDHVERDIGLRSVRMNNWIWSINGERLFLAGTSAEDSAAARDDPTADVDLARELGVDLLRLRDHVRTPATYAAADEAGLLIWQDLPGADGIRRSATRRATRLGRAAVGLLGHHPSIATWMVPASSPIERRVNRAVRSADPSRPEVSVSGTMPAWLRGDVTRLPTTIAAVPRFARFVDGGDGAAESTIRFVAEVVRRVKYRPAGGFTLGTLDHASARAAIGDVCRDVLTTLDPPLPDHVHPGDLLRHEVHVVSDLRHPIQEATITVEATWTGGEHRTAWAGELPADSVVRVGTFEMTAPHIDGALAVAMTMTAPDRTERRVTTTLVIRHD